MRDKRIYRIALLAILLALTLAAGLLERAIPLNFVVPGVKLGLGNVIVLVALTLLSMGDALILAILKCMLTALLGGSFTSFAYSLGGSMLSFAVMALLLSTAVGRVSVVGVSVAGAVFHNIGQLLAVCLIMGTALVWAYLPVLLVSGVISGVLTGLLASFLIPRLKKAAGK